MEVDKLFDSEMIVHNRRRARTLSTPGADFLLNIVNDELLDRLNVVDRQFDHAVALHAHTSTLYAQLKQLEKVKSVIWLEQDTGVSETESDSPHHADLESIPPSVNDADLVISPLSLHLVNDLPGLLFQIKMALRADGLFLAALPGADTLNELRDCLISAETELTEGISPRVIPFADVRDCGSLLQRAGFALPVVDAETYTIRYDTMFDLIRDLRAMGMGNSLAARSRTIPPRALFFRAAELYAQRYGDPDGRVRATFKVIYLSGWSPHESQQKPLKPGSAEVSLTKVLGQDKS